MPHSKLNIFEAISLENLFLSSYEIIKESNSTIDADSDRFHAPPFSIKIVRSNLTKAAETSVWFVSMLSKLSEMDRFIKLVVLKDSAWIRMITYFSKIAQFYRPIGCSQQSIRASGTWKWTKCSNFVDSIFDRQLHKHSVRWPLLSIYVCCLRIKMDKINSVQIRVVTSDLPLKPSLWEYGNPTINNAQNCWP